MAYKLKTHRGAAKRFKKTASGRNKKLFFAAKCTEALVEAINTAASV